VDEDFADCIVFYPHIPRAIDVLLKAMEPEKYSRCVPLVSVGAVVAEGEAIARYGDITITAPFDGRIEFLGATNPGLHEWPDIDHWPIWVEGSETQHRIANLNVGALVFPDGVADSEAYLFALRPVPPSTSLAAGWRWREGHYPSFGVRYAFDHGNVWLNMDRKEGHTFYTIIDLAVFEIESPGSGMPLPEHLRRDKQYSGTLARYWPLIHTATARVLYLGPDTGAAKGRLTSV